eukprot:Rmarinus@m.7246
MASVSVDAIDRSLLSRNGRSSVASAQVTPLHPDFAQTFWSMKLRKFQRMKRQRTRTNEKDGMLMWAVIYALIYASYYAIQVWALRRRELWMEYLVMTLVTLLYWQTTPRVASVMLRVLYFETYFCFFLFYIFDAYGDHKRYLLVFGIVGFGMASSLVAFFAIPYLLRLVLIYSLSLSTKTHAGTHRLLSTDEHMPITFGRFELGQKTWCLGLQRSRCVYEGELREGRPDGFGSWVDTSYGGEQLTGIWKAGTPVGPFKSQDAQGHVLVNLRIVYACNGGGYWWLKRTDLRFGIASVECVTTGGYYQGYPLVETIKEIPECLCEDEIECTCVAELLQKHYIHISDRQQIESLVVTADKGRKTLDVTSHRPREPRQKQVTIRMVEDEVRGGCYLSVDDHWLSTHNSEGILYIHGYHHDLQDGLKRFGQFLSYGQFPSYIKPFIYCWPAANNPLLYVCASNSAADRDCHRDLAKYLHALAAAGVRHLHIMCHSMGARLFLRAFATVKDAIRICSPTTLFSDSDDDMSPRNIGCEDASPLTDPRSALHRRLTLKSGSTAKPPQGATALPVLPAAAPAALGGTTDGPDTSQRFDVVMQELRAQRPRIATLGHSEAIPNDPVQEHGRGHGHGHGHADKGVPHGSPPMTFSSASGPLSRPPSTSMDSEPDVPYSLEASPEMYGTQPAASWQSPKKGYLRARTLSKRKKRRKIRRRDSEDENLLTVNNLILLNPDYELDTFTNDYAELQDYVRRITLYSDPRDTALEKSMPFNRNMMNLGKHTDLIRDARGRVLDIDVIDTGDLTENMSATFHGFFNVSRTLVDDLHDVIVMNRRASLRMNRLTVKPNGAYRFSIIPSTVTVV